MTNTAFTLMENNTGTLVMEKIVSEVSDNIMLHFTPGTDEYEYMFKTVKKLSWAYSRKSPLSQAELESSGWIAAWEAALSFDEKAGAKFMTWAHQRILNVGMLNEIRKNYNQNSNNSLESAMEDYGFDVSDNSESERTIQAKLDGQLLMDKLEAKEKLVLSMTIEGRDQYEIAEALGKLSGKKVSRVTAAQIKSRAIKSVNRLMA